MFLNHFCFAETNRMLYRLYCRALLSCAKTKIRLFARHALEIYLNSFHISQKVSRLDFKKGRLLLLGKFKLIANRFANPLSDLTFLINLSFCLDAKRNTIFPMIRKTSEEYLDKKTESLIVICKNLGEWCVCRFRFNSSQTVNFFDI